MLSIRHGYTAKLCVCVCPSLVDSGTLACSENLRWEQTEAETQTEQRLRVPCPLLLVYKVVMVALWLSWVGLTEIVWSRDRKG